MQNANGVETNHAEGVSVCMGSRSRAGVLRLVGRDSLAVFGAPNTVTTRVAACNTITNGTVVEFTYTNTDDSSDWPHTTPRLWVSRWDDGQRAYLEWTQGSGA